MSQEYTMNEIARDLLEAGARAPIPWIARFHEDDATFIVMAPDKKTAVSLFVKQLDSFAGQSWREEAEDYGMSPKEAIHIHPLTPGVVPGVFSMDGDDDDY